MNLLKLLSIILILRSGFTYAQSELGEIVNINEVVKEVGRPPSTSCPTSEPETKSEELEWEENGYANTTISFFSTKDLYAEDNSKYTHQMDLMLVNLRGSGFGQDLIKKQMKNISRIYKQCRIKFNEIKFVESDPPDDVIDISYDKGDDTNLARKSPESRRPILFFARSNIEGHYAYAWGKSTGANPPRRDTGLITSSLLSDGLKNNYDSISIAHEIGHILCGCAHTERESENLMSGSYSLLSENIDQDQCEVFKKSPLIRKVE